MCVQQINSRGVAVTHEVQVYLQGPQTGGKMERDSHICRTIPSVTNTTIEHCNICRSVYLSCTKTALGRNNRRWGNLAPAVTALALTCVHSGVLDLERFVHISSHLLH